MSGLSGFPLVSLQTPIKRVPRLLGMNLGSSGSVRVTPLFSENQHAESIINGF